MSSQTEWKNQYLSLKKQVVMQDKEWIKVVSLLKTTLLKNEILGFEKSEEKKEFDRYTERDAILNFIRDFRLDTKRLRSELRTIDVNNPSAIEYLQRKRQEMEDKILKFKDKQMYMWDELSTEASSLDHDIDIFCTKLHSYDTPVPTEEQLMKEVLREAKQDNDKHRALISEKKKKPRRKFGADSDDDDEDEDGELNEDEDMVNDSDEYDDEAEVRFEVKEDPEQKEIDRMEKQMARLKDRIAEKENEMASLGGKNCGWTNDDHASFLKIKTKHGNNTKKMAFLNDCITTFGYLPEADIRNHIQKYEQFVEVESEKKKLLDEYNRLKKDKKDKQVNIMKREEELAKKRKEMKEASKGHNLPESKEEVKKKLSEWKKKSAAEKELANEKQVKAEQDRKGQLSEKEKKRLEDQKRLVAEYKEMKEMKAAKQKELEEYRRQLTMKPKTQQDVERVRMREDSLIRKKQEVFINKQMKHAAEKEKKEKLAEKTKHNYAYIEPKLNEATKASNAHQREKFDGKVEQGRLANNFAGNVVRVGGLAIPAWRQGMI